MKEEVTQTELAKMIDHSLLHPTMTDEDVEALINEKLKDLQ